MGKRQSNDVRAKPGMMAACTADIKASCPKINPGTGNMHLCLRQNKKQLKNPACIKMVQEVQDWEAEDISINPAITLHCGAERKGFCGEFESGDGRLSGCLQDNIKEDSFGIKCKGALMKQMMFIMTNRTMSEWKAAKHKKKGMSVQDVMTWLENKGFVGKQQGGILTGAIAG